MSDAPTPIAAEEVKDKFLVDPYMNWAESQGIPIHLDFGHDLLALKTDDWELYEARGCFAHTHGRGDFMANYVLEVPKGAKTKPVKHLYEAFFFVLSGHGSTTVYSPDGSKRTFEWGPKSVFAIPLNCEYQIFNGSGAEPARLSCTNDAPLTLNLYHNERYVFDNPFVFDDRYSGQQGFFNPTYEIIAQRYVRTNMVTDVRDYYLHEWTERGQGARTVFLTGMSHHTIGAHVSEFPPGTYKKAHRHGPGAHVIILEGEGYSLNWKEGDAPTKVDWRENSMFSPPDMWYHQHFNTGTTPARYLALKSKGAPEHPCRIGAPGPNTDPDFAKNHQIEYEDEDPAIYDDFAAEVARNGGEVKQPRPKYNRR